MADEKRPRFVQALLRFFRKSAAQREQAACSAIIEKHKNVERYRDVYPITNADYTQYRWRAVKGHGVKSSSRSSSGCLQGWSKG